MFHAILVIGESALWGNKLKFTTRITFHWVLQLLAWLCIGVAFYAIYTNKNLLGKQHFHTTHALVGLGTLIAANCVIIGGVWAKYSLKLRWLMRPVRVKLLHSFLGILAYNSGVVAIGFGLYTKWWDKVSDEQTRYYILAGLAVTSVFVSLRPLKVCARRLKTAFGKSNS